MFESKTEGGNIWIAVAIVIAGAIVAAALVFTNGGNNGGTPTDNGDQPTEQLIDITITEDDHMVGNLDAPIKIVEYSDTECPFCKRLHKTLQQVVEEYGDQVVWVYRHLPIDQLHSKAFTESVATECVAELGGEDAFWSYINRIYEETPSNNGLDLNLLTPFAVELGIDQDAFETCLVSDEQADKVRAQREEGYALGAKGTPFSVVITPNGETIPVSGALPIDTWRQILDSIIENELN